MQTLGDMSNQEGSIYLPIAYVHDAIIAWENKYEQNHYDLQNRELELNEYRAQTARIVAYGQLRAIDNYYDIARRNDETQRIKDQTERMKVNASITFDATARIKDQTQRVAIILGLFGTIVAAAIPFFMKLI